MPRAVRLALTGEAGWTPEQALREIGHYAPDLRRLSHEAQKALEPVDTAALADRLSMLQLAMTNGWSADKAKAWLHETCRLLADLPADIVLNAIDEAVKASERGFMPGVGEIRAFADPKLVERQRIARRLRAVAEFQAGHRRSEPSKPSEYCDTAEAALIIDEFGLRRQEDAKPRRHNGPPSMPTEADYIEIMGAEAWAAAKAAASAPIDESRS